MLDICVTMETGFVQKIDLSQISKVLQNKGERMKTEAEDEEGEGVA